MRTIRNMVVIPLLISMVEGTGEFPRFLWVDGFEVDGILTVE